MQKYKISLIFYLLPLALRFVCINLTHKMKTFTDFDSLNLFLSKHREDNKSIGFVPTMGALHDGHLSLLKKSVEQNDISVCSVFVNPTQFNNLEDLETYPRNDQQDAKLLANNHCDALFLPSVEEVYPDGQKAEKFDFNGLEHEMEGKFRPGHFDGVGTILHKLFSSISPNKAYFGEKDFQQFRIVQTLAHNFFPNIEILPVEIFREKNGLAMSSRNTKLSEKQKEEATLLFKTLEKVKEMVTTEDFDKINTFVESAFQKSNIQLEYFTIANEINLKTLYHFDKKLPLRAFIAAFVGEVRLIDNMKLN